VAPIKSFTRFQLAAIIDPSIYRILMVFRGSGIIMLYNLGSP
jgi:hypothetical protein